TQKRQKRGRSQLIIDSDPFLGGLEYQVGDEGDYRQGDQGPQQENHKQLNDVDRYFAAQEQGAHFRHINQLGHRQGGNHETGQVAFDGGSQDRRNEHVGKAHHYGLGGGGG